MFLLHYCLTLPSKPPFPMHLYDPNVSKHLSKRRNKHFPRLRLLKHRLRFFVAGDDSDEKSAARLRPKHEVEPLPSPPISSALSLTVFSECHPDSPLSAVVFASALEN